MKLHKFTLFCVLQSIFVGSCLGLKMNALDGSDIYTKEELKKIPALREKVKDVLTKPYMLENSHLVRFLRARNSNLNEAEALIRNNYRWRQLNDVDMITTANFSRWQRRLRYNFNVDREQRPGVATSWRNFDLRQAVLRGYHKEILKYNTHINERLAELLPVYGNITGKEFVAINVLYNVAGFNARTHLCLACIPFWVELVNIDQNQYPEMLKRMIIINVPRAFETLLRTLRPVLDDRSATLIQAYGVDKSKWQPVLLKMFSPEELTTEFGGTGVLKHWSQITFPQDSVSREALAALKNMQNP